jgi:hypothetical protein
VAGNRIPIDVRDRGEGSEGRKSLVQKVGIECVVQIKQSRSHMYEIGVAVNSGESN